jgi:type II secretory pathway predicted ATPase ExeA
MSMPAWLTHFGFREPPFSKEIPDADLWLPPSKAALVDDLVEALDERASALLVGDPGVGKTCVLRALKTRLPEAGFRLTYCHNATLGRRDFYRQLCLALGLTPSATAAALFYAISSHVQDLGKDKIHPVFLLDEAHLLHQDTLDHLHILLNYAWDSRALLSLLLVGLPELQDRLALRRNRSLYSRLHHRFTVGPITLADTAAYVALRLKQAGGGAEVFTAEALARLHEATSGVLRDIDRIAGAALRDAARKKRKAVDRDVIDRALQTEPVTLAA